MRSIDPRLERIAHLQMSKSMLNRHPVCRAIATSPDGVALPQKSAVSAELAHPRFDAVRNLIESSASFDLLHEEELEEGDQDVLLTAQQYINLWLWDGGAYLDLTHKGSSGSGFFLPEQLTREGSSHSWRNGRPVDLDEVLLSVASWEKEADSMGEIFWQSISLGEYAQFLSYDESVHRHIIWGSYGIENVIELRKSGRENEAFAFATLVDKYLGGNHFFKVTDEWTDLLRENGCAKLYPYIQAGYNLPQTIRSLIDAGVDSSLAESLGPRS
jgi:hypothetical protein